MCWTGKTFVRSCQTPKPRCQRISVNLDLVVAPAQEVFSHRSANIKRPFVAFVLEF